MISRILFLGCFFSYCLALSGQKFTVYPSKREPGTQLTLNYQPADGPLDGQKIGGYAFCFQGAKMEKFDLEFQEDQDGWHAFLPTTSTTSLVSVLLVSPETGDIDNDHNYGYFIGFYSGDSLVNAYHTSLAFAVGVYATDLGIAEDVQTALMQSELALQSDPTNRNDILPYYAFLLSNTDTVKLKEMAISAIREIEENPGSGEDDYMTARSLAVMLGDASLQIRLENQIRTNYPGGRMVLSFLGGATLQLTDPEEQSRAFEGLKQRFRSSDDQEFLDDLTVQIIGVFEAREDWDWVRYYLDRLSDPLKKAGLMNSMAWKLAGASIKAEALDLDLAEEYARKSVELLRGVLDPFDASVRPNNLSPNEYHQTTEVDYANAADTYAMIRFKSGDFQEALDYGEMAERIYRFSNPEINERYVLYHVKAVGGEESLRFIEQFVQNGLATAGILNLLDTVYQDVYPNNTQVDFEQYLANLNHESRKNQLEMLEASLINMEAGDFNLKDLAGDSVSLASLQGKIVILDFWASWCGPCLASFPAMQQLVDQYAQDDSVKILFINTMERVADPVAAAQRIMTAKGYSFRVLLDQGNKMAADYQVDGLPTKLVLDGTGRIRFREIGSLTDGAQTVEEFTNLITILKKQQKTN